MESNHKKYSVLIVDYMNYDSAVEVPYLFSQAGCEVTVFCDQKSWLTHNSFYDKQILPLSKNTDEYLQQLEKVIEVGKYDYVCPVDDEVIRMFDESRGSKSYISNFCKINNFLTPNFVIENIHDPEITFPALLKIDKSQGGKGVLFCGDEDQMTNAYQALSFQQKKNLVIQKYIKGENVGMEAFFDHGKLTAYVFSRIEKTVNGEFGISSERVYFPCPTVLESEMIRFGKLFNAHGFASITFIHEVATDKYYLIEFDSRTNAWLRHARFVGVDFSCAIRASLAHKELFLRPQFFDQENKKILWHFPRDLIRAFLDRDIKTYFRWVFNIGGRWKMIPWYDPKLIWSMIIRIVKSLAKRII